MLRHARVWIAILLSFFISFISTACMKNTQQVRERYPCSVFGAIIRNELQHLNSLKSLSNFQEDEVIQMQEIYIPGTFSCELLGVGSHKLQHEVLRLLSAWWKIIVHIHSVFGWLLLTTNKSILFECTEGKTQCCCRVVAACAMLPHLPGLRAGAARGKQVVLQGGFTDRVTLLLCV